MKIRCFVVEYKGNNKAVFECPQGHKFRRLLLPRKKKGIGEGALQMMASWWSKAKGGVSMECPVCEKERSNGPR